MKEEKPKEKCGVFGYFGKSKASERVYLGLHNLQHRGQESSGICSWNGRDFKIYKGMGIVNDVFDKEIIDSLDGYTAIGHVRYSTQGSSTILNAQPILKEKIAIAHNGEIENYEQVKQILKDKGIELSTTSDTEVFLKLISSEQGDIKERITKAMRLVSPSYSIVMLIEGKLIGIRDPAGVRPLEIGRLQDGYAISSETVGFDIIGAEYLREIKPGEIVIIDENGIKSHQLIEGHPEKRCIFEMIYFSRPDSLIEKNISIGMVRREFGKELYKQSPIKADVVIEVPDSSSDAAMGVCIESGIPYDKGLSRSHYIGRTFIEPSQELRNAAVLKKFNVNMPVVKERKVILVDDSLVRGTTLMNLVKLIKEKGAKEVHVMISSPPYIKGCNNGVNTSDESVLIARHKTIEEIKDFIGADSLTYLDQKRMLKNQFLKEKGFCTSCFDGNK